MIPGALFRLTAAGMVALGLVTVPGKPGREAALLWQGELCTPETDAVAYNAFLASLDPDAAGLPQQSSIPEGGLPERPGYDPARTEARFELRPTTGETATAGTELAATLTLVNRETGAPVTGEHVAGWMDLVRNGQVASELPCAARVGLYAQGRVTHRADADLNASRLMVLSRSGTISVIDPQVDFTITQMQTVIQLPGVPADWALSGDRKSLFVSLPMASAVAVIDTSAFSVAALIELDKGSQPTTLLPLSGGGLAVALSGQDAVTVLHPEGATRSDPVATGGGRIALAEDRAGTVFALSEAGRLSALSASEGRLLATAELPSGEPSLAMSPWNRSLYAVTSGADSVAVFSARDLAPRAKIGVGRGIYRLGMTPGGRSLVAVKRAESRLLLLDGQKNRVVNDIPTVREPVEIAFSDDYAYVRGLAADHFALLEREALEAGDLTPVDIQSSSRPLQPREALASARMIVPYPGGAMIGNAEERLAYYYMEGMNAPMGTVQLYGPDVQGILTLDRGFREVGPGVYQSTTRLQKGGSYTVAMAIGDEGAPVCFDTAVASAPGTEKKNDASTVSVALEPGAPIPARVKSALVLKLTGDGAAADPDRIRLVAFSPSGRWQARQWAVGLGDGRYAADWEFPRPGRYGISIELPDAASNFASQKPLYFKVVEKDDTHSIERTEP